MCRKCNRFIARIENISLLANELEGEIGYFQCGLLDRGVKIDMHSIEGVLKKILKKCDISDIVDD